jgi:hypothetical protein
MQSGPTPVVSGMWAAGASLSSSPSPCRCENAGLATSLFAEAQQDAVCVELCWPAGCSVDKEYAEIIHRIRPTSSVLAAAVEAERMNGD